MPAIRVHRILTLLLALLVVASNILYLSAFGFRTGSVESTFAPGWRAFNNFLLGLLMISLAFVREPKALRRLRWLFLGVGAFNLGSAMAILASLAR